MGGWREVLADKFNEKWRKGKGKGRWVVGGRRGRGGEEEREHGLA